MLGEIQGGNPLLSSSNTPNNKPAVHQAQYGTKHFVVDPQGTDHVTRDTQYPYVTGTSVVSVKFKDGVIVACDTGGAYGRTKRYKDLNKILKVNDKVLITASGEISDLDYIGRVLHDFTMDDYCHDDNIEMGPKEVHSILSRIMYNRRTDLDPLWNTVIVAGLQDDEPYIGYVGMIGVHFTDDWVVTGLGRDLSIPQFTETHSVDMSEEDAVKLVVSALRSMFYRDSQAMNKFRIGIVKKEGTSIGEPFAVDTNWSYKKYQSPSENAVGVW